MLVLNAAKELGKLMTTSVKKAEARVGGFTSGGPSSARRGGAGGVTLSDINNNLRLLVDALRRLVELGSLAVGVRLTIETYANLSRRVSVLALGLRVLKK
jgi:chloramphenicol 3-O-phosphotransferase